MPPRTKPLARTPLDEHPLLEARNIDGLTTAVRALNMTIAKEAEARAADDKLRRAHESRQLAMLELIAKHTENLPALMDLLVTKRTNGHGHHPDDSSNDASTG